MSKINLKNAVLTVIISIFASQVAFAEENLPPPPSSPFSPKQAQIILDSLKQDAKYTQTKQVNDSAYDKAATDKKSRISVILPIGYAKINNAQYALCLADSNFLNNQTGSITTTAPTVIKVRTGQEYFGFKITKITQDGVYYVVSGKSAIEKNVYFAPYQLKTLSSNEVSTEFSVKAQNANNGGGK